MHALEYIITFVQIREKNVNQQLIIFYSDDHTYLLRKYFHMCFDLFHVFKGLKM